LVFLIIIIINSITHHIQSELIIRIVEMELLRIGKFDDAYFI